MEAAIFALQGSPIFFILPENMQNKAKEIPSLVLGTKMEKVFCRVSYGPSTLAMHVVHNCMFWPCTGVPANKFNFSNGSI